MRCQRCCWWRRNRKGVRTLLWSPFIWQHKREGFFLCRLEKPFSYSRNIQSGSGRAGLTGVYKYCCSCACVFVCVCLLLPRMLLAYFVLRWVCSPAHTHTEGWQQKIREKGEEGTAARSLHNFPVTAEFIHREDYCYKTTQFEVLRFRCSLFSKETPRWCQAATQFP